MIRGYLVYAGDGTFTDAEKTNAKYGCGTYDLNSNPSWKAIANNYKVEGVILVVERNPETGSGCFFSTKVYSAQIVPGGRVKAVLVVDTDSKDIVLMRDDGSGTQVFLSSMFIGSDVWNALKANWNRSDPYAVYTEMEYYLPNPDGRVEMDILYSILDPSSIPFLTSFGAAGRVLAQRLRSQPHFWVTEWSCPTNTTRCAENCISVGDSPYYCQSPATFGALMGVKGKDALMEIVREVCLFNYLAALPASITALGSYPEPMTFLMWTYWEKFYASCAYSNSSSRFTDDCSYTQMKSLTASTILYGSITQSVDTNFIKTCVTNALKVNSLNQLWVFEQQMEVWDAFNPPINAVRVYINNETYPGDVQCRLPITEATCGPLSAICYGYATDTTYPVPCSWDNQCTFGLANCTGIKTVTGNSGGSGVSAGAVVGIIIAFLVILIAGLYYWYRRQQQRMKGEVDALLKQYLPMDPGATHGVAQGATKMREQHERRLIQDMDLEDQDMETRDDI